MRAGWMRPSATSLLTVSFAIARRTPSKPERTTAWGVSSMITSTPVRFSSARMLRPSRPMMRPFMSSEGSSTIETVVSAAWLAAVRWMPIEMMLRTRRSDSWRASSSMMRMRRAMSWRERSSTSRSSSSFACVAVRPETRSSASSRAACSVSTAAMARREARLLLGEAPARGARSRPRAARPGLARADRRSSPFASSTRRSPSSRSTSVRIVTACSLAATSASLRIVCASRRASSSTLPAAAASAVARRAIAPRAIR